MKKTFLALTVFAMLSTPATTDKKKEEDKEVFTGIFSSSWKSAHQMIKRAEQEFEKGMEALEKNFKEIEKEVSRKIEGAKDVMKKIEKEVTPSPTEISISGDYNEKKDKYIVEAKLPGIEEKDVTVKVETVNGMKQVTISASKSVSVEKKEEGYLEKSSEKRKCRLSQTLQDDVNIENFKKTWKDGELKIEFAVKK